MDIITYLLAKRYINKKIKPLASGMTYKGSKPTVADLPTSGNTLGDVWTISADGSEYVWTGAKWEKFGADPASKQDKLIAGNNITIAADGKTISAQDTKYTVTVDV